MEFEFISFKLPVILFITLAVKLFVTLAVIFSLLNSFLWILDRWSRKKYSLQKLHIKKWKKMQDEKLKSGTKNILE